MLINEMEIDKVYSFSTHGPAILGSRIEKARLGSVCNFEMAKLIAPIEQLYAQLFPGLPSGSIYDPKNQKYFVFTQQNKEKIVLAGQWIVENSIQLDETIRYSISIYDGKLGDSEKILSALKAIGYKDINVSVV